jgi:hypothetical protein
MEEGLDEFFLRLQGEFKNDIVYPFPIHRFSRVSAEQPLSNINYQVAYSWTVDLHVERKIRG